jgi:AcrR family transcriptional regulator
VNPASEQRTTPTRQRSPEPSDAPEPGAPGRRERKKLETRAALEAAAMRLFAEQGYERTTVEEAHDVSGRLRKALAARPAGEHPVEVVRAAMVAMDQEHPDQQREILERMRLLERLPELNGTYHMLFQQLHEVIAEAVASRTAEGPVDLYPQLIAAAATGAIKAALSVFEATAGRRPLADLRDEALDRLTLGLRERPDAPDSTGPPST